MSNSKPWLKNYPDGVPSEIGEPSYASLTEFLEECFERFGNRKAVESMSKFFTYRQIDRLSRDFASYLHTLGLEKGARVALMYPNVIEYIIAMLGTLRAGYVVVNINPLYTPRELEAQLHDSGSSVLIMMENFANTYQQIAEQTPLKQVIISSPGELLGIKGSIVNWVARNIKKMIPAWDLQHIQFKETLEIGSQHVFHKPVIGLDDIAFLQYTGGTTGTSKGAVLLHRNILSNVIQIEAWLNPGLKHKPDQQLNFLCALPMTHIFALTACALLGIAKGGLLVLVANPRDIDGFIKSLMKHPQINIFPGVNTLFHALIHRPEFKRVKLPNLLVTIGGGMAVHKKTADHWQALTGCPIAQGYGLSETSPVVCVNSPLERHFTGHIGMPMPSTDVVILDDDEVELLQGTPGEICIKGPQVMAGYWNKPEETSHCMTKDGYFKSGDIGLITPEGHIQIVDRKKDMIVVAGFKVFPNDVEDVLSQMQGIKECAVIGVPHRKLGEIVKAYVVKSNHHITESDILQYCKEHLTSYKRPRKVVFIHELPKSNVGKILRRELRNI
ncbi:long-chain fatty acid--CoA ligase [Polynucleobacter wuianus]|uniref:Long-chain-fatty-acid--CoA ligase n=1 Tax=Polynucleobacter wuianus TaxID=1743168 RepID=A0A191UFC5_9BURK|nr:MULTISPECIES: AMP-binding protein [Polynucleobacter]ANI99605.1 long-chain fatty acid--CoA ligase [Polynucleobacter wuianus]MBU3551754.1 AMP-binding protein [Polynucleobacter sp. MWH-Post4-6-1]